jgi:hypothetical protein
MRAIAASPTAGADLLAEASGPELASHMRFASKRPEFINAWRVLSVFLALCLVGVVFAHHLPFPSD